MVWVSINTKEGGKPKSQLSRNPKIIFNTKVWYSNVKIEIK